MREGGISYGITKDDPPPPPRPAMKRSVCLIKARFKNKCGSCGEWIEEGDLITPVDDGYDGIAWVCERCGEES